MDLVPTFITNREVNIQRLPTDPIDLLLQVTQKIQAISIEQARVHTHLEELKDLLTHQAVKLLVQKKNVQTPEGISDLKIDEPEIQVKHDSRVEIERSKHNPSRQADASVRESANDRFERVNRNRQKYRNTTLHDTRVQPSNAQYVKR